MVGNQTWFLKPMAKTERFTFEHHFSLWMRVVGTSNLGFTTSRLKYRLLWAWLSILCYAQFPVTWLLCRAKLVCNWCLPLPLWNQHWAVEVYILYPCELYVDQLMCWINVTLKSPVEYREWWLGARSDFSEQWLRQQNLHLIWSCGMYGSVLWLFDKKTFVVS